MGAFLLVPDDCFFQEFLDEFQVVDLESVLFHDFEYFEGEFFHGIPLRMRAFSANSRGMTRYFLTYFSLNRDPPVSQTCMVSGGLLMGLYERSFSGAMPFPRRYSSHSLSFRKSLALVSSIWPTRITFSRRDRSISLFLSGHLDSGEDVQIFYVFLDADIEGRGVGVGVFWV